jgi:hypothetical protein
MSESMDNWGATGERDGADMIALVVSISDESWRAFADGGELQWLKEPNLLTKLSRPYAQIKTVKYIADKYIVN